MELQTYDSKLIDFLSNYNTVVIYNREEYEEFRTVMNTVGLSTKILDRAAEPKGYAILIEYDNSKGFTIWNWTESLESAIKKSTEWYYDKPLTLKEIKLI